MRCRYDATAGRPALRGRFRPLAALLIAALAFVLLAHLFGQASPPSQAGMHRMDGAPASAPVSVDAHALDDAEPVLVPAQDDGRHRSVCGEARGSGYLTAKVPPLTPLACAPPVRASDSAAPASGPPVATGRDPVRDLGVQRV